MTGALLLQRSLMSFVCSSFFGFLKFIQFNLYQLCVSAATMDNRLFVV